MCFKYIIIYFRGHCLRNKKIKIILNNAIYLYTNYYPQYRVSLNINLYVEVIEVKK